MHSISFRLYEFRKYGLLCLNKKSVNLSHARMVQAAIIQSETEKTSKTVPGQIVINVFITNLNASIHTPKYGQFGPNTSNLCAYSSQSLPNPKWFQGYYNMPSINTKSDLL